MYKHLLLAGLTLAFTATTLAESTPQPKPHHGHHMFQKMDADGDGNISLEEHEQGLQKMLEKRRAHFSAMDVDGDGLVSKDEAAQAREKMRKHKSGKRPDCPNRPEN